MSVTREQFKELLHLIRASWIEVDGFTVYLKINRLYDKSNDFDTVNDPYVEFISIDDEYILLSNKNRIVHESIITAKYKELRKKFYLVKQL